MDIKTLLEGIEKLVNYLFGGQPPEWLLPTVTWTVGIGSLFSGIVVILSQARKLWIEFLQPIYYNPEQKRRRARRRMFADIMEAEIRRLNSLEAWNDNRFAELEAEVEAEGRRKLFDVFRIGFSSVSNLHKERSLSKALERSSERLILVEGDPGSGKSVALRHLAQNLARKAHMSNSLKSLIPLYINLKQLRRMDDQTINHTVIEKFVLKTLNRINDRDVEDFLGEEFKRGLEEGTWLFLFDSFDEIPDILSSTESDTTIREYAEAISDFLHRMNRCRGIVASREYKGPRFLGWPKFRILPLTLDRKRELIKRTGLRLDVQKVVTDGISQSTTDFRYLTGNPMFLNLLCEYMNKAEIPEFPRHTHKIFNDYVWKRLKHDEERLQQRFSKTPEEIRSAAEKLAFCMTADTGMGLNPTIDQLEKSTQRLNLDLGAEFTNYVSAIEYLKLARLESSIQDGSTYFTFAHRRFQEYFATAVVLREPDRVDAHVLLTDARWRETAVVIIQTQPLETITPLFNDVSDLLKDGLTSLYESKTSEPKIKSVVLPSYSLGILGKSLFESRGTSRRKIEAFLTAVEQLMNSAKEDDHINLPLEWPRHLFHILGILQEGLSTKYELIPGNIRQMIDDLVFFLMQEGSLDDRKWALDIAGCASLDVLEKAIDIGLSSPGAWVKNSAILQISKLAPIPDKFSKHIISNLFASAQEELLLNKRYEIYAQFARFSDTNYLNVASLIVWMPIVDLFLTSVSVAIIINLMNSILAQSTSGFVVLTSYAYLIPVVLFVIIGITIRWRSSSILKAIADIYSSDSSDRAKSAPGKRSKGLRVKQPKRSDLSLTRKLLSLLMGNMVSVGGFLLFGYAVYKLELYVNYPYVWVTLIVFFSFQLWSLIATIEALRLKRTSVVWRLLYFFYPVGLGFLSPFPLILYLADQLYIFSRMDIAIGWLRKSPIRDQFIPFMYGGNYYADLWMPIPLLLILAVTLELNTFQTSAGIELVVVIIGVLFFAYLFGLPLIHFMGERETYTNAVKNLNRLDMLEFINLVERVRNRRLRSLLIHSIFDKGYVVASPLNASRLRILIAFIQTSLASEYTAQNFKGLVEVDSEVAAALGYIDENNYPLKNHWNEDHLDLLCRMLEQMQKATSS